MNDDSFLKTSGRQFDKAEIVVEWLELRSVGVLCH